jgi:hypothetical protein
MSAGNDDGVGAKLSGSTEIGISVGFSDFFPEAASSDARKVVDMNGDS